MFCRKCTSLANVLFPVDLKAIKVYVFLICIKVHFEWCITCLLSEKFIFKQFFQGTKNRGINYFPIVRVVQGYQSGTSLISSSDTINRLFLPKNFLHTSVQGSHTIPLDYILFKPHLHRNEASHTLTFYIKMNHFNIVFHRTSDKRQRFQVFRFGFSDRSAFSLVQGLGPSLVFTQCPRCTGISFLDLISHPTKCFSFARSIYLNRT